MATRDRDGRRDWNFLTNTWIVAAAVALDQGETVFRAWRVHFMRLGVNYFAGGYVALLLALFAPALDTLTFMLLAPLPLVLHAALRMWVGRINDRVVHLDSMNQQRRATIEALAHAIDAKDQVTHGHIRRVQAQSLALARDLGCTDEAELGAIEAAGLLHDLGKLAIPEHILNKPGRLTHAEFSTMQTHSAIGADILAGVDFPYPVVPIVRHHHENWDGTGYPDGLSGDRIPFGARVLAVVDCFDALTSARPYRAAMAPSEALSIIRERRGTMYDPSIVDAFLAASPSGDACRPGDGTEVPLPLPASASLRTDNERWIGAGDRPEFALRADAVLAIASGTLGAAAGVVFAYVEETDAIAPVASMGLDRDGVAALHMRLGERLSGWVGAARRAQHDTDARLDLPSHGRLRAAVSVPIVRGDALLGVITMYGHAPGSLTDLAAEKLDALAAAMAGVRGLSAVRLEPKTATPSW